MTILIILHKTVPREMLYAPLLSPAYITCHKEVELSPAPPYISSLWSTCHKPVELSPASPYISSLCSACCAFRDERVTFLWYTGLWLCIYTLPYRCQFRWSYFIDISQLFIHNAQKNVPTKVCMFCWVIIIYSSIIDDISY
jgi:hypothetical protein